MPKISQGLQVGDLVNRVPAKEERINLGETFETCYF